MTLRTKKIIEFCLLTVPAGMYALGFWLNQLVIAANGGTMPVLVANCTANDMDGDRIHACMTHASHLKFLADWINLHVAIASPGDLLLWFGDYLMVPCLALFLYSILTRENE